MLYPTADTGGSTGSRDARPAGGLVRFHLAAALVGCLAGLLGAAFHAILDLADRGRALLGPAVAGWPVPGWLVYMGLGALALTLALWLVRRFAPETAGSGIQEVEAILAGQRELRWRRVLPVKFVAGALAVGSGLVLGREGPTVHMGSALGRMAAWLGGLDARRTQSLIAAGAGAGLAAAFNAPLAAIVFVTEELREHFEYSFHSLQSVILACCLSVLVCEWLLGQGPSLPIQDLATPSLVAAPLFLVLGVLIGALGVLFNRLLLGSVQGMAGLRARFGYAVPVGAGAVLGALLWLAPQATGGGEDLVESLLGTHPGLVPLLLLLAIRTLTSVGSYGLGLPGGIFAPMLALGTIAGAAFDLTVDALAPGLGVPDGVFALAAMGALFAATVRAPLTGIVLAIELTGASGVGLPIILTCLSATFAAQAMGGRPVYSLLLALGGAQPWSVRRSGVGILVGGLALGALLAVDWGVAHPPGASPQPVFARTQTTPGVPEPEPVQTRVPDTLSPASGEPGPKVPEPMLPDDRGDRTPLSQPPAPALIPAPALPADTAPDPKPTAAPRPPVQGRYSVQLIGFRKSGSVAPFVRRYGLERRIRVEQVRGAGGDWYLVLLGDYATRAEAEQALERLPEELGALSPLVRAAAPTQSSTDE